MTFLCLNCQTESEHAELIVEREWEPVESPGFPNGSELTYLSCPECGSTELEEINS